MSKVRESPRIAPRRPIPVKSATSKPDAKPATKMLTPMSLIADIRAEYKRSDEAEAVQKEILRRHKAALQAVCDQLAPIAEELRLMLSRAPEVFARTRHRDGNAIEEVVLDGQYIILKSAAKEKKPAQEVLYWFCKPGDKGVRVVVGSGRTAFNDVEVKPDTQVILQVVLQTLKQHMVPGYQPDLNSLKV